MLFGWIQKYSLIIFILVGATSVLSVFGAQRLHVTPDNRVFYGSSNTYFQDFLRFESDYTDNNNILFVVYNRRPVHSPEFLSAVDWLTDQAWRITNSIRVDSISSYPVALGHADEIEIVTIADTICSDCDNRSIRHLKKPQIVNRLVSPDLRSTGVVVTVALEMGVVDVIERITSEASALAEEFRARHPDFELVVTGGLPMMQAFATYSAIDLGALLPIAFVTIFVLLSIFLGGTLPAISLVLVSFVSVLITLGLSGWTGHVVNSVTSIVPLVVFTLVVTSSMHILIHYVRLSGTIDGSSKDAARAALQGNLKPMLVSSATTMVGLLSLLFLDSPPFRELGYLSAFGVLVGTVLSLVLLPLLLGMIRRKHRSKATSWIQERLNGYARQLELGRSFALPTIGLMSISLFGLTTLKLDDDFVKYFSTDTEFRRSTDRATDLLASPNHIEVLLTTNADGGVFDPRYVAYLDETTSYIRQLDVVSNVSSFSDVLRDLSEAFGQSPGDDATGDEMAQWYLVYELSLQRGQSNTDFVRGDHRQTRVSVLLNETTSSDIQRLESHLYDWHAANHTPYEMKITGENIPVAHLSGTNIKAMVSGIFLSLAFTAIVVGLSVRRPRLGLVALVATVLPITFGFGIWGLFNDSIGLAATAIIALTIGVVVDDAVHMVYRYMDARSRLDTNAWQAAAFSLHRVGTALSATSVVMIGGLAALLFSNFELNSSFGECTCLIIATALVFDLFVLPRLLVWSEA